MRLTRSILGTALAAALMSGMARAEAPASPLRLIPAEADVVIQVDSPRRLVEAYTTLDLLQQLYKLDGFKEALDATNSRRFFQLVAYFEQQLGSAWPETLDKLGGGGVAVGFKLGPQPAPVLLVMQSKDEATLKKFVELGLRIMEQELARQDVKVKAEKGSHREQETIRVGDEFHAAIVGGALLVSNRAEALHRGIDLHIDGDKKSMVHVASVAEARKLLPADSLASLWLNLETVQKAPQAKEVFVLPRNDVNLTVLFGGWLDVAGRAPFLAAALVRKDNELMTTVRMPRGKDGSNEGMALHIPPAGEGALPLLEPKGVLYSTSYYLDAAKLWQDRAKLMNDKAVKGMEDFDKRSALFLAGNKFNELITQAGPHQRFVAVHQEKRGYKTIPGQRFPAFAFVVDTRKPEFGKSMETILRGAAFFAGTQVKMKLIEEKHGDVKVVGYRFVEDPKDPPKAGDVIYNFSPAFVTVGDQLVACSTIELAHDLVDVIQEQAKVDRKKNGHAVLTRVYGKGGADFLNAIDDQLFAQTMLESALPPAQAKEQVRDFLDIVRKLGVLQIESEYRANDFRYDLRLIPAK